MENITDRFAKLCVIAEDNPDGFTVDKYTLKPIKKGYAIAVIETQNSHGLSGLQQTQIFAEEHSFIDAIGGWLAKSGKYYFDAVIIVDNLQIAAKIAEMNKQIAFYDLTNQQTIYIKQ